MASDSEKLAQLRTQMAEAQGRQDWSAAQAVHNRILALESDRYPSNATSHVVGGPGVPERSTRPRPNLEKETAEQLEARMRQLASEERAVAGNPLAESLWRERRYEGELPAIDSALERGASAPEANPLIEAHRAGVRATHARLASTNPIAAAAYLQRHEREIFGGPEDAA
jgi:hypothetical protein